MKAETARNLFDQIDRQHERPQPAGMVSLPLGLVCELMDALGEDAEPAEPAPAEIAAVDKIVLAREIRRIVGTANEHRKTMRNAWHGIGTLEHVADADRHARSGLETLENTLNYFDHKFRDLMDVIDAETDGDDNG